MASNFTFQLDHIGTVVDFTCILHFDVSPTVSTFCATNLLIITTSYLSYSVSEQQHFTTTTFIIPLILLLKLVKWCFHPWCNNLSHCWLHCNASILYQYVFIAFDWLNLYWTFPVMAGCWGHSKKILQKIHQSYSKSVQSKSIFWKMS